MKKLIKDKAQKILDRLVHHGVKDFEIFIEAKQGTNLEIKDGLRDAFEIKKGLGFALRILKDQKLTFSYGLDFSDSAIDFVVKNCLDSLPYYQPDPHLAFVSPKKYPEDLILSDARFDSITYKEKFELLLKMEATAKNHDKKIMDVKHTSLDDELERVLIINSNGVECYQEKSAFCISAGVQAGQEEDQEIAYDMESQILFKDLQPQTTALHAAGHAVELLGSRPIKAYKGPLMLDRDVVVELLDVLAPSFICENIFQGRSYLAQKLDQNIYARGITIMDDGLLKGGMGSGCFDGEGNPKQTTILVEDGVFKTFLYDELWAHRKGVMSTGNCCREDMTASPDISYNNFYIAPGATSYEQMLAKLHNGLLITDVIGMHNADEVSGEFSVGIQGLEVKNGKKSRPIKSMIYTGNLHKMLKNVVLIGSDLRHGGGLGAPSLLIEQGEVYG